MPWKIAVLFLFAYECYALQTNRQTLSNMVYVWSQEWTYLPFLVGFIFGALSSHFFWRWDPTAWKKTS